MNRAGQQIQNKKDTINYLREQYKNNRLLVSDKIYTLIDNNKKIVVQLDIKTGHYLNSTAGEKKSNRRAYIKINGIMVPNYTFRVICDGLVSQDFNLRCKLADLYDSDTAEINHINGDTEDNSSDNLEVVNKSLNTAHSRFMSEVYFYFPSLIDIREDCQGNKMHSWKDKKGVSCKQIDNWNKTHNKQIKAFKDKKGEFNPRFTKAEIKQMLLFFEKEVA